MTDPFGESGTWEYFQEPDPEGPYSTGGEDPHLPTETRTHVVTPLGHCTRHYFAADEVHGRDWAYDLPFSPELATTDGLHLSTEAWTGSTSKTLWNGDQGRVCAATRLRSSYLLYDRDPAPPIGTENVGARAVVDRIPVFVDYPGN